MANRKNLQVSGNKRSHKFFIEYLYLHGIPEKIKSDKGRAFVSKEYREFCKNRNIEIEYCSPEYIRETEQ